MAVAATIERFGLRVLFGCGPADSVFFSRAGIGAAFFEPHGDLATGVAEALALRQGRRLRGFLAVAEADAIAGVARLAAGLVIDGDRAGRPGGARLSEEQRQSKGRSTSKIRHDPLLGLN